MATSSSAPSGSGASVRRVEADALVIGGGLAGLYAVLHLPESWRVVVIDKGAGVRTGSSPLAQGGMAVAVAGDDSPELHAGDTLRAGAGACVRAAVDLLAAHAGEALADLVRLGCEFDVSADGSLDLNLEGGQSVPRSVHWADATGREIMRVVVKQAADRARRLSGAALQLVVDDGRCVGAVVVTGEGPVLVGARVVLLAAGGCGALYDATTNVDGATGDGIAMAWEAGADVADLEFVQFHPTVLASGGLQRVLLTEALRGHGAVVVDGDGKRFLLDCHPDGELAPRDVVARAIAERGGAFLDARTIPADVLRRRFPNVHEATLQAGFDLTAEPVPVAPAAHYMLGGVATDLACRTTLPGLYAAGECAASGIHGANRMAGNSLTEALVFGRMVASTMVHEAGDQPAIGTEPVGPGHDGPADPRAWERLRAAMSHGAGLVRTASSLAETRRVADEVAAGAGEPKLRLAAITASLICRSAQARGESRGVHYRADAPDRLPEWDGAHVSLRRPS